MKLEFDLEDVQVTEFGVGLEHRNGQNFVFVPVDAGVQKALHEMAESTWSALQSDEDGPTIYEPSEKYAAIENLYLPLVDDMAEAVRHLQEAASLDINTAALADPKDVFCYFARFTDKKKRRLTALRRASQFKGVVKSKNRLMRMHDDTLRIIGDRVFRLDNDFDLLVDSANVHILRPSGFEFAGKLQQAILGAVPENIKALRKDLAFVDFDAVEAYAGEHTRAARYLASIRGQKETRNIDKSLLKKLCERTGVQVAESHGRLIVTDGHEMAFLEVLDRRRYEISLVREKPERYRAASRKQIKD